MARSMVVEDDDASLVAGLKGGSASSFNRAYAKYGGRVYGFLLRLAGRRDIADDLFQETWMRLARSAPSLRDDTVLLSWLFTVARNQFVSYRRWSILDVTRLLSFGAEGHDVAPPPDDQTEATARLTLVDAALRKLSPESREALVLVAVEGIDQEEAAKILGIGYAALRQRLSRARAELDKRMSALEGGAGSQGRARLRGTA